MSRPTKRTPQARRTDLTDVTRYVPSTARLLLVARTAGRCEFDGCNKYLFRDSVTKLAGNFAQVAHIIAFSPVGPRGARALATEEKNDIPNLMLLCPVHHKLVDDSEDLYPVRVLRTFKRRHEDRIKHLTGLPAENFTTVLILKSRIGSRPVQVTRAQVQRAIAPRYPAADDFVEIDLTTIPDDNNPGFLESAKAAIDSQTSRLYETRYGSDPVSHISVFALAPIPVLMYLGSRLSDKIPVALYQRHRDTEGWTWNVRGTPVEFGFREAQVGTDRHAVALLLSISGSVGLKDLPSAIDDRFSVYEMTPLIVTPSLRLLRTRADLDAFTRTYEALMTSIATDHAGLTEVLLFPALPAPAAIAAGRALLEKRHPRVVVYDFDKRTNGFTETVRIN